MMLRPRYPNHPRQAKGIEGPTTESLLSLGDPDTQGCGVVTVGQGVEERTVQTLAKGLSCYA